jgi:hypothetical protein
MNGMQVMDRAIVVEQAAIAAKTKEKGTANPYAAIKAAHLQQVMIAQMQQAQLAAQVAAMRVQAKTNPSGVVAPGGASAALTFHNHTYLVWQALHKSSTHCHVLSNGLHTGYHG